MTTTLITVRVAGSLTGAPGTYREATMQQAVPATGRFLSEAKAARDAVRDALRASGHTGLQVTAYPRQGRGKSEARA